MIATLAGNFLLIGFATNLIVTQRGATTAFWPHFTVGAPLAILPIAFGVAWLGS